SADFTSGTFNGRSRSVSGGGAVPVPVQSRPTRHLGLSPSRCTRFVSTSGSDTSDGSSSAPFRTISHAEAAARPGDVVCARGGTYREDVRLTRSGAKGSPITVAGAPGESAIIDGANLPIGPTDALLGIAGGTD